MRYLAATAVLFSVLVIACADEEGFTRAEVREDVREDICDALDEAVTATTTGEILESERQGYESQFVRADDYFDFISIPLIRAADTIGGPTGMHISDIVDAATLNAITSVILAFDCD